MKEQTVRLEFNFSSPDPDGPQFDSAIVDHVVTAGDWREFSEDMIDRGIDRDYWCDHEGEWYEKKYQDHYRDAEIQRQQELR